MPKPSADVATTPAPQSASPYRRRYAELAVASSMAAIVTLGGVAVYGAQTEQEPKSSYSIEVFQAGTDQNGIRYSILETRLAQADPGTFVEQSIQLGSFACGPRSQYATIDFTPHTVSPEHADIFNANLGPICAPNGAMSVDAAAHITASLAKTGIIQQRLTG